MMDVDLWLDDRDIAGSTFTPRMPSAPRAYSSRMQLYAPTARQPIIFVSPSAASIPSPKPKGLPMLGEKLVSSEIENPESSGESRKYRLPKIASQPIIEEEQYQTWSRHGYEVHKNNPDELLTTHSLGTPRLATYAQLQEMRRKQYIYPHFQQAIISPTKHNRFYAGNVPDPAFYKSFTFSPAYTARPNTRNLLSRPQTLPDEALIQDVDSPDPIPASPPPAPPAAADDGDTDMQQESHRDSPPKSGKSVRSIHWALTPYKKQAFDKKGISRNQGPFSREFTRTCGAPKNWMKMKWGRAKTSPVTRSWDF